MSRRTPFGAARPSPTRHTRVGSQPRFAVPLAEVERERCNRVLSGDDAVIEGCAAGRRDPDDERASHPPAAVEPRGAA